MLSLVDPYAASTSRSAQQCCTQFSIQRCLQPAHACRPPLRTCVVAYRSPRMAPCPRRVPLAMRAPASRRAARTEIARLRYGRPRRTERRRRATETHFTHPWLRTGGHHPRVPLELCRRERPRTEASTSGGGVIASPSERSETLKLNPSKKRVSEFANF